MDRFRRLNGVRMYVVKRVVAWLAIAALAAAFGVGRAHAQDYSNCHNYSVVNASCATGEEALAAAIAGRDAYFTSIPSDAVFCDAILVSNSQWIAAVRRPHCSSGSTFIGSFNRTFPSGNFCSDPSQTWNPDTRQCESDCASNPDETSSCPFGLCGAYATFRNGSVTCRGGCTVSWYSNGDGSYTGKYSVYSQQCESPYECDGTLSAAGYVYNAYAQACVPPPADCDPNETRDPTSGECRPGCPEGQSLDEFGQCKPQENTCPPGQVKSPDGNCLPGEGECAAGEARRADGTCGKDDNDDGVADDEDDDPGNDSEENSFSGGDDCNTPPSCSGDPIMCGQARIQWRIDCNTRKNRDISGGTCNAVPICTGEKCDALEYASLVQQWRTTCHLQELLARDGTGDGGQPDWTRVDGMSQDPGEGVTADDTPALTEHSFSTDDLDQSGLTGGGGGACTPLVSAAGGQLSSAFAQAFASPPPFFCDFIHIIKAIVVLSAAVVSCYILAKGG